jgi:hypothetical protein
MHDHSLSWERENRGTVGNTREGRTWKRHEWDHQLKSFLPLFWKSKCPITRSNSQRKQRVCTTTTASLERDNERIVGYTREGRTGEATSGTPVPRNSFTLSWQTMESLVTWEKEGPPASASLVRTREKIAQTINIDRPLLREITSESLGTREKEGHGKPRVGRLVHGTLFNLTKSETKVCTTEKLVLRLKWSTHALKWLFAIRTFHSYVQRLSHSTSGALLLTSGGTVNVKPRASTHENKFCRCGEKRRTKWLLPSHFSDSYPDGAYTYCRWRDFSPYLSWLLLPSSERSWRRTAFFCPTTI